MSRIVCRQTHSEIKKKRKEKKERKKEMAPRPILNHSPLQNETHLNIKRMTPLPLGPTYNTISIPASYGRLIRPPTPGSVVGIVLGSVFGFIFLLYLVWLGISSGRRFGSETQTEVSEVSTRRRRSRRIVVEEERPAQDHIIVEESMTSGPSRSEGDVIEVFEENSSIDPPPRRPRRGGGWRRDMDGSELSSRV
ncbi:hypothetical protein BDV28DRAFT_129880 [Aspergillus coremiiformis]|uniref:Transmembrane protein n=1 Tax=Aspergillus coremiiformis TaxID=138285 RepID=A0A5N6ZBD2_9EURO|nr:hypothetical protein BDV28DRAFT_129880 [Aspergillus coremiiformis]